MLLNQRMPRDMREGHQRADAQRAVAQVHNRVFLSRDKIIIGGALGGCQHHVFGIQQRGLPRGAPRAAGLLCRRRHGQRHDVGDKESLQILHRPNSQIQMFLLRRKDTRNRASYKTFPRFSAHEDDEDPLSHSESTGEWPKTIANGRTEAC